jgi:hypothetical protein
MSSYSEEDKKLLVQGIAGIGTLAFCDNSEFYVSKVGPVAFLRMIVVLKNLTDEGIAETGLTIFKQAREDGTIPIFSGEEVNAFTATDEAGCRVVEDIVSKLMEPKGLLDVEPPLAPGEQKS